MNYVVGRFALSNHTGGFGTGLDTLQDHRVMSDTHSGMVSYVKQDPPPSGYGLQGTDMSLEDPPR